ncbi:MAG: glycosyltransferase family 1 protein [Balneolaceae bacterium]|nr:glycosyltransferase family 1 protein [Balneolaceae bacterium]
MNELRVAIFTGNYNHIRDGVSLTLNRLVDFLEKRDVKVLVVGPTIEEPAIKHNGELLPVPSVPMPGRSEYRLTVSFPDSVKERLAVFDPNLFHIATPDLLGFRALRYAQSHNIQVVASYHTHFTSYLKYYNLEMLEKLAWKYLVWFYGQCRHVYVPSPSMADELNRQGISDGIRIWARGVNTDHFHPGKRDMAWRRSLGISDDELVITFVSRLVWEKDLQTYVDTVQRIKKSSDRTTAMVVGDGPAKKELQQMLPNAHFTGFITGRQLHRAYASSDIFLFPSDTETFGNVTLEAMSSGLPCVVADATGSKSLVESGVNGYLAPPRNTEAFTEATLKIVNDDALRKTMGETARQKALAYSWDSVNEQLLENYHDALADTLPQLEL